MHTVKNLVNSPHDLSIRLPAMGSVTAIFAPEYLEALRGMGCFEITDVDPLDHDRNGQKGGMAPAPGEDASVEDVTAAVALLDADNDDHWTAAGLPKVEAVAELAGKTVTRKAIEEAAPDAKRPTD